MAGQKPVGRSSRDGPDRAICKTFGGTAVVVLDVWAGSDWHFGPTIPGAKANIEKRTASGGPATAKTNSSPHLLTRRQEKLLKRVLADSSITAVVLCGGVPFIGELPPDGAAELVGGSAGVDWPPPLPLLQPLADAMQPHAGSDGVQSSAAGEAVDEQHEAFLYETRRQFHWGAYPQQLEKLLADLCDWMAAAPRIAGDGDGKSNDHGGGGGGGEGETAAAAAAAIALGDDGGGKRAVVLLCGGTRGGVRTMLEDRLKGVSLTQLCVGPVSEATVPCPWTLRGSIADRFVFHHLATQEILTATQGVNCSGGGGGGSGAGASAGSVAVGPSNSIDVVIRGDGDADGSPGILRSSSSSAPPLIADAPTSIGEAGSLAPSSLTGGAAGTGVHLTLGPIIGMPRCQLGRDARRDSLTVPVLVETNRAGTVTCTAMDALTGEPFGETRHDLPARRPRAFWLRGLRPARRYVVSFRGVDNAAGRTGVFTAPDVRRTDLSIAVVSQDRPGELTTGPTVVPAGIRGRYWRTGWSSRGTGSTWCCTRAGRCPSPRPSPMPCCTCGACARCGGPAARRARRRRGRRCTPWRSGSGRSTGGRGDNRALGA
ncbi:unnamed protein product [Phaeothamnion confervicola]